MEREEGVKDGTREEGIADGRKDARLNKGRARGSPVSMISSHRSRWRPLISRRSMPRLSICTSPDDSVPA